MKTLSNNYLILNGLKAKYEACFPNPGKNQNLVKMDWHLDYLY